VSLAESQRGFHSVFANGADQLPSGLLLIFGIFYFLLFLPMQRQRKQQQKMLASLQNGSVVVTSGGIVGTIVAVEGDDTLVLRVKPDNVKIQVTRSSVSSLVPVEGKK
jgi:preprotein translocase subunit YajC